MAVFTPATNAGSGTARGPLVGASGFTANEEVGGEERPEEHDLDPMKEHPEGARVDAGALVGSGRRVVLVVVQRLRVSGHQAVTSVGSTSTTTCWMGRPLATEPPDEVAPEPAGALAGTWRR